MSVFLARSSGTFDVELALCLGGKTPWPVRRPARRTRGAWLIRPFGLLSPTARSAPEGLAAQTQRQLHCEMEKCQAVGTVGVLGLLLSGHQVAKEFDAPFRRAPLRSVPEHSDRGR